MTKVAFIYYFFSPFIRQDYEIISRHFEVEKVNFRTPRDIFKIARAIFSSDLTYAWFVSGHSFLAVMLSRILHKRSIVVAGGYDVAFVPEMNYGQYTRGRVRRMFADYVLKNADVILAVSNFTRGEVLDRAKPQIIKVIYNGINTDMFFPGREKEDMVITIAGSGYHLGDVLSDTKNMINLKGIETFVQAAEHNPDVRFLVMGLSDKGVEILKEKYSLPNLELHGYASQEKLIDCYRKAKVYCQLSYRESFGVALAEAMACECVPVVTDRGALPEVVGDTGIYVPYGDEKATANGIKNALKSDKGALARERIENRFSLQERERALIEAMESLQGE
jgi:glycosyltransferase involved in cell wall biosynthesis